MHADEILAALLLLPLLLAAGAYLFRSARWVLVYGAGGVILNAAFGFAAAVRVLNKGPFLSADNWLMLDTLSAYHLIVMLLVFSVAAVDSLLFFLPDIRAGRFLAHAARRYVGLCFGALAAMMLVLLSNNLGIAWVGIEATTLVTAFLINVRRSRPALEAMWKYLLMCSVGVGVAFTGLLFLAAAGLPAGLPGTDALLWTRLSEVAIYLDPTLLKAAFIFIVIGYGVKAGLAPMHYWLPDAHSQAPAPVSAIFSGFMINAAFYCILRFLPIVESATGGDGWAREILLILGLLSIVLAGAFIVAQRDLKRLLAYSSVEHIGIMALGAGLGGIGYFAALLHMLNHALAKSLAFLCAGHLGELYGTHDMRRLSGIIRVAPSWGIGLSIAILTLIGAAPFSIFLSELLILKAAIDAGAWLVAAVFVAGLAIIFVGVLRQLISMAWSPAPEELAGKAAGSPLAALITLLLAAGLLTFGIWLPPPLLSALRLALQVLGGGL